MAVSKRIRTDLALEATETLCPRAIQSSGEWRVQEQYDEERDVRTTVVKIATENGAKAMGRPQGTYITIEAPDLSALGRRIIIVRISEEISKHLRTTHRSEKGKIHSCGGARKCRQSLLMHWDRM